MSALPAAGLLWRSMSTLRIEHAITDYGTWKTAFDGFADVRAGAGVRAHAIRRPLDDAGYLMLDLEFDTADAAESFARFLHARVWSSPEAAPALAGVPRTRVLELVEGPSTGSD